MNFCKNVDSCFIYLFLILTLALPVIAQQPTLFFNASDIPALQAKIQQPEFAGIYNNILQNAIAYCTPGSGKYVNPADPWFQNGQHGDAEDDGYYGRDVQSWIEPIGFAYQMTGNPLFGQHGAAILAAAAEYEAPPGSILDKNIDMLRTFAVGYDWLAPAMTPAQKSRIEQVSREYILWFQGNKWGPYHNFMGVGFGGQGLLAIAMRDAYPAEANGWVSFANDKIITWFNAGFDDQGAYYEGHDYMQYGYSNAIAFGDAFLINDGISIFNNSHLRQISHYLSQIRLPGEDTYEARNDSAYSTGFDVSILRLASAWQDGLTMWLWNAAQPYWNEDYHLGGYSPMRILWSNNVTPVEIGNSFEPLAEHFIGRGLVTFRTGWGVKDALFTMEAGPYYHVTHNQADKGHFGLYAYGKRWAVDPGYGNNIDVNGRCQTVAHNCILVDGVGQALSGASYGTNGKILAYENTAKYGYALADSTDAYNINNHNQPGAIVEHALRHSIFVRGTSSIPSYAVILDDIKKDTSSHIYTWQLLSWADMNIDISGSRPVVSPRDYVVTPENSSGTGTCSWQANVSTGGTYYIWAQGGTSNIRSKAGSTDSFYVNIANSGQFQWNVTGTWQQIGTHFSLFPEPFEIKVITRERGAKLFRIWITTDPEARPPVSDENQGGILLLPQNALTTAPMQLVDETGGMDVYISAQGGVNYGLDMYEPNDGRTPAGFPRLKVNTEAVNPYFMSVLVPGKQSHPKPVVTFYQTSNPRKIIIKWPARIDTITWSDQTYNVAMESLRSDINEDGIVNFEDFAILAGNWLFCSEPANSDCLPAN